MPQKEPHIVFKTIRFLINNTELARSISDKEFKLLIILANHKGHKGIYPSTVTLAKEMNTSKRWVIKILKDLVDKKLIIAQKRPGKSSFYELNIPNTTGEQATSLVHEKVVVNKLVHHSGELQNQSGEQASSPNITKINNIEEMTEREALNNALLARASHSPLSLSFFDKKTNKDNGQKPFNARQAIIDQYKASLEKPR